MEMEMCTPPVRTVQVANNLVVFSQGGNAPSTSDLFVVTNQNVMQVATLLDGVRATVQVDNADGDNFENRIVYQLSDDGSTWDSPVSLDAAWVGGSVGVRTTAWKTEPNWKRAIRFGVEVQQAAGVNRIVMAKISVVLDFRLLN